MNDYAASYEATLTERGSISIVFAHNILSQYS